MPLLRETEVAFWVLQLSVLAPPCWIEVGLAEREQVGAFCVGGTTVIVAEQLILPPWPVAVSTYVVVPCGATPVDPFTPTLPMLVIDTVDAFCVVQVSVEPEPRRMVVGAAESVQVGAFGVGGTTVIVAEQLILPPWPVATRLYVVVWDGVTVREPPGETGPMPWSSTTLVALLVVQLRLDTPPCWMLVGLARSVQVGACGGWLTATVA
jgi:hypothetical protein